METVVCRALRVEELAMKAIYRHKKSGDLFAIETDEKGRVLSTSGPLSTKNPNPHFCQPSYFPPFSRGLSSFIFFIFALYFLYLIFDI